MTDADTVRLAVHALCGQVMAFCARLAKLVEVLSRGAPSMQQFAKGISHQVMPWTSVRSSSVSCGRVSRRTLGRLMRCLGRGFEQRTLVGLLCWTLCVALLSRSGDSVSRVGMSTYITERS